MSENRRDAWRLPHQGVGWLAAKGFRAACVVQDISVTGARIRVSKMLARSGGLPDEVSLTTVLGGEQVTVPGTVTRTASDDDGLYLGIHFLNGDAFNLGWLINQAQRQLINAASSGDAETRRTG